MSNTSHPNTIVVREDEYCALASIADRYLALVAQYQGGDMTDRMVAERFASDSPADWPTAEHEIYLQYVRRHRCPRAEI
jgi:hypothetical protein